MSGFSVTAAIQPATAVAKSTHAVADYTVPYAFGSRGCVCDDAGALKVDLGDAVGVEIFCAQGWNPWQGIKKIYKVGSAAINVYLYP